MLFWRDRYRKMIRKHGAAAVARVVKMPRSTLVAVVAGIARPGNDLLAESRVDLLDQLDALPNATKGERAS